jgi:hypothetical protein
MQTCYLHAHTSRIGRLDKGRPPLSHVAKDLKMDVLGLDISRKLIGRWRREAAGNTEADVQPFFFFFLKYE